MSLCDKAIDDDDTRKTEFICTQLSIHSLPGQHQGKQYSPFLLSEAANLYLRSRNAYRALRLILILPHEKTLHSFFGKFGSAGNAGECVQAIIDAFSTLEDHEKFVFISADEIYVKPAIRYRGGNVIGFAQNHDTPTPAKTVLAAMINFLRGSPASVARLVPVVNLKHKLLVDLLLVLISIIHESGGFVMGIVTNLYIYNKLIYESTDYELQNIHHINRRFSNCFFKVYIKKQSDQLSKEKKWKTTEKKKFE